MYKSPLKVKDSVKRLVVTIGLRLNFDDHINWDFARARSSYVFTRPFLKMSIKFFLIL